MIRPATRREILVTTSDRHGRNPGRLRTAAELVPLGARVADIGTDHGLLPRILVDERRAAFCIATELRSERFSRPPGLRHGERLRRIELRTGDGLAVIDPADRIEVLTLTGLGGRTIVRILEDDRRRQLDLRRIVIQPQSEWALLRTWLAERGLGVVEERLILERGRYYLVLAAESRAEPVPRHATLSREDLLEAGPRLVRSPEPLVQGYWREQLEHGERILRRTPSGTDRVEARRRRDVSLRVLAALPSQADRPLL